jgi:hypothetical protein
VYNLSLPTVYLGVCINERKATFALQQDRYYLYGNLRTQFQLLDRTQAVKPINTLGGGFIEAASAEPLPERAEAQTLPISLLLRANESTTKPNRTHWSGVLFAPMSLEPARRQSIKVDPAKGLDRKQIAPDCNARARVFSSGKAVININGTP